MKAVIVVAQNLCVIVFDIPFNFLWYFCILVLKYVLCLAQCLAQWTAQWTANEGTFFFISNSFICLNGFEIKNWTDWYNF